ncbi:MAG: hypothetical protein RLZZ184_17 [Cyanobacteriota bacterium]|jgi:hypothetical protein
MIKIERYLSSDYETVGYYTRSHVDKNLFLDAVSVSKEDEFINEPQNVRHECWKIMNDEEMQDEGVDGDGLEYYSLSEESDPRSFPVTVFYLDDSYKVI